MIPAKLWPNRVMLPVGEVRASSLALAATQARICAQMKGNMVSSHSSRLTATKRTP
jgi:hypothetical protein